MSDYLEEYQRICTETVNTTGLFQFKKKHGHWSYKLSAQYDGPTFTGELKSVMIRATKWIKRHRVYRKYGGYELSLYATDKRPKSKWFNMVVK